MGYRHQATIDGLMTFCIETSVLTDHDQIYCMAMNVTNTPLALFLRLAMCAETVIVTQGQYVQSPTLG